MMPRLSAISLVALLFAASAPALAQSAAPAQEDAAPAEDEAAAAATDPASPDYVRCKRVDVIGSRAKKERICKTNAEWERVARGGNDLGRDTVDRSTSIYRAEGM